MMRTKVRIQECPEIPLQDQYRHKSEDLNCHNRGYIHQIACSIDAWGEDRREASPAVPLLLLPKEQQLGQ